MLLKKQKVPVNKEAIVASKEVGPDGFYPISVIDKKVNDINKSISDLTGKVTNNTTNITNIINGAKNISNLTFNREVSPHSVQLVLSDSGNFEFNSYSDTGQAINFDLLKNGSKVLTDKDINTTTDLNIATLTTTGKVKIGGQLEVTNQATFNNTVTFNKAITTNNGITVPASQKITLNNGSQLAFEGTSDTQYLQRSNNDLTFNNKPLATQEWVQQNGPKSTERQVWSVGYIYTFKGSKFLPDSFEINYVGGSMGMELKDTTIVKSLTVYFELAASDGEVWTLVPFNDLNNFIKKLGPDATTDIDISSMFLNVSVDTGTGILVTITNGADLKKLQDKGYINGAVCYVEVMNPEENAETRNKPKLIY